MGPVALKLGHLDGGHNKFLESMVVYLEINAPRYWWQEFDTYRIGVTKQSESTMHTLTKDDLLDPLAFEPSVMKHHIDQLMDLVKLYRLAVAVGTKEESDGYFLLIKANLPEGFMQKRLVCTNYKTLRNISMQRRRHRLPHWQEFCRVLDESLSHPQFLKPKKG